MKKLILIFALSLCVFLSACSHKQVAFNERKWKAGKNLYYMTDSLIEKLEAEKPDPKRSEGERPKFSSNTSSCDTESEFCGRNQFSCKFLIFVPFPPAAAMCVLVPQALSSNLLEKGDLGMPQIFRIGGYKIYFWSGEERPLEPIHVHVSKGRPSKNATKIWLAKNGKKLVCHNERI